MRKEYQKRIEALVASLDEFNLIKAPIEEYIVALKEARERVVDWIDSSIEASEDDLRRNGEE